MIIDFMYDITDIDKFVTDTSIKDMFDFNKITILTNIPIKDVKSNNDLNYIEQQLIVQKNLEIIDSSLTILADQIVAIDFLENEFIFHFDNIVYSTKCIYSLILDIPLTDFGKECKKDSIDLIDMIHKAKGLEKINNFCEFAPDIFKNAFTKNDLKNIYITHGDYELDDIKDLDFTSSYIIDMITHLFKAVTSKLNIEGPDDFQLNIYKNLYDYYEDEATFMTYGNFVCCFYNLGENDLYNKLCASINNATYTYINIYDITQPSNTPGVSMNSIESNEKTTYIKASFKLVSTI